jgi:hypothetical protein
MDNPLRDEEGDDVPVLRTRTIAEAYMYLELTLDGDEPRDYGALTTLRTVGEWEVLRVDGRYGGRHHRMNIVAPKPPSGAERGFAVFGHDDAPSTMIDPTGWRMIETWHGPVGEAELGELGDRPLLRGAYERIVRNLATARGAIRELRKFLPAGADEIPREAYFAPASQRIVEMEGDAYRRDRIDDAEARYTRLLDDVTARYATSGGR